jgi:hypothetical protein
VSDAAGCGSWPRWDGLPQSAQPGFSSTSHQRPAVRRTGSLDESTFLRTNWSRCSTTIAVPFGSASSRRLPGMPEGDLGLDAYPRQPSCRHPLARARDPPLEVAALVVDHRRRMRKLSSPVRHLAVILFV